MSSGVPASEGMDQGEAGYAGVGSCVAGRAGGTEGVEFGLVELIVIHKGTGGEQKVRHLRLFEAKYLYNCAISIRVVCLMPAAFTSAYLSSIIMLDRPTTVYLLL